MQQSFMVSGETINSTMLRAFEHLDTFGLKRGSRNGGSKAVYNTTYMIEDAAERHLHLDGRKSNIFQLIAETFWVLAGAENIDPYLTFFLPRAPQYSDDGVVWHGAYGPRMYKYNQHVDALNAFLTDGLDTRRSFIQIADLHQDAQVNIDQQYGQGHKAKDIPCNREMHFYVHDGKRFCAKTIQRSGDMLFGAGSINPFEFSFIQELMFHELKKTYPELELGPYMWHVTNAHVYDQFYGQVTEVLKNKDIHKTAKSLSSYPTIGPAIGDWEVFFSSILSILGYLITVDDSKIGGEHRKAAQEDINSLFDTFNVPRRKNQLMAYVKIVIEYIIAKKMGIDGVALISELFNTYSSTSLRWAVVHSPFMPKKLELKKNDQTPS